MNLVVLWLKNRILFNPFTLKFKENVLPTLKEKLSEVVKIGNVIIFHLSKLWKAKFFKVCDVSFLHGEAAGESWNWSLLGVKGLMVNRMPRDDWHIIVDLLTAVSSWVIVLWFVLHISWKHPIAWTYEMK